MCKVVRKNKKSGSFYKKTKKLEDAREAKDVLVALAVTLTFCSPIDVRVINLPRHFNKHIKVCVCVFVCVRVSVCVCVCVYAVVWTDTKTPFFRVQLFDMT